MVKSITKSLILTYKYSKKLFILNILITVVSGTSGYLLILANRILLNSIQHYLQDKIIRLLFLGLIDYALINFFIVTIKFIKQYFLSKQRVIIQAKLDFQTMEKNGVFQLEDYENNEIYSLIQSGNQLGKQKILEIYIGFIKILEMLISIFMCSFMMLSLSPDWWIFIVFLFPVIKLLIDIYVGKINYKKEKSQIEPFRRISYINYLTSNDIAKKEMITYRFFSYWFEKFKAIRVKITEQDIKILKKTSALIFIVNIIETTVYILIIGIVVLKRIALNLIGDVFAYIDTIMMIQNNTTELLSFFSDLYKDSLYAFNYFEFINKNISNSGGTLKLGEIDSIDFKNLIYNYPNKYFDLKIDDLKIEKGKPTIILGKNGSGKTTLIKMLSNLYNNYNGDILINEVTSLRKIDCNDYYDNISVLFQDFNKYEATLRENIAMSNTHVFEDERIMRYIDKVKMKKIVEGLDDKLDTMMGNWFGNTVFSGGQWQRIAIIRCLLKEAQIYILDEPTSALDKTFEKDFFGLLKELMKDKICVIVIHKLTSEIIKLNPYIVILENGEIKYKGSIQAIDQKLLFDYIE
ncbi:Lipid A export ATP-binding/permease protein MsbA [Peptoniphilus lacrimalis]|uniref:Lipid A export ATP-binding/permease protein MsbA n=1 Tax=Peptoniphilus lacrimalis TaxID=33031 RepID=A0A379C477_9FIRM|nr:Lipid A export ATP-binding/permease protein MsbA [Peptoniphilus lacrimalis]